MKKIDTRFAERIRAKRKAKALRQYQLANLVGIDPVYISQIETGRKVPTVPIAKRLGLGSVLGYLIAGTLIGPFGLGLIGEEGQDVMHFAEFGVVMMLFLVGLELQPSLLWRLCC